MASGRLSQGSQEGRVPAKSCEPGSRGPGRGLPRAGQAQASSLEPICLSGRRNPKHPARSLCPAGTGPVACPVHVAGGGREREGGTRLPDSKASVEATGRASLLGQWMGKLRLGAEKSLVQGHFVGGAHGTALVGPDLCPGCLRAPLCVKGQAGQGETRASSCPGLGARLSKKQTRDLGGLPLPPCTFFCDRFQFSVISSVGFSLGQPFERGHACSQDGHCLPFAGLAVSRPGWEPCEGCLGFGGV